MATTLMPELPREFLAAARKGQEYALDAIRTWAQTVQSAIPELRTPQFPFADRLPKPETVLANAYDFAGQLLASQRHFAEELLKATEPLMPAIGNGRNAPDATDARQTPAADTTRTAASADPAVRTPPATAHHRWLPGEDRGLRPPPRTLKLWQRRSRLRGPCQSARAAAKRTAFRRPPAPAAHTAAGASTPRTTSTAPSAAKALRAEHHACRPRRRLPQALRSTTRTAPKAAASRRQPTPKAGR